MTTKILIVEDEIPIREMIAFHLSRAGFETSEAGDCKEARALIADAPPDLVVIDWMLPDMSGIELTRLIRRDSSNEKIGIIMLTARAEERDKVAGLDSGADDYVTKPFSSKELISRIKSVLRRTVVQRRTWCRSRSVRRGIAAARRTARRSRSVPAGTAECTGPLAGSVRAGTLPPLPHPYRA